MSTSLDYVRRILADWPSSQPLSASRVLARSPPTSRLAAARELIAIEAYLRSIQSGGQAMPSELARCLPASLGDALRQLPRLFYSPESSVSDGGRAVDGDDYPQVGESIANYRLIRHLGDGAFSRVYLAADSQVGNRRVAVKLSHWPSPEAALLGQIQHSHLPRVLAQTRDEQSGLFVLVMDYVGKETLASVIARWHPTAGRSQHRVSGQHIRESLAIAAKLTSAVAHVHAYGLLHLDIKPSNIVMRTECDPVLIDFNLGATLLEGTELGFRGTVPYCAPEVLEALNCPGFTASSIGPRADVYSLGVVVYEMLTGTLPWPARESDASATAVQARRTLTPPSQHLDVLCDELDAFIERALAFAEVDRFRDPNELLQHLQDCLRHTSPRVRRCYSRPLALAPAVVFGAVLFGAVAARNADRPMQSNSPVQALDRSSVAVVDPATGSPDVFTLTPAELSALLRIAESDPQFNQRPERVAVAGIALLLLADYPNAVRHLRNSTSGELADDVGLQVDLAYALCMQRMHQASLRVTESALVRQPMDQRLLLLREANCVALARSPEDAAVAQSVAQARSIRQPSTVDSWSAYKGDVLMLLNGLAAERPSGFATAMAEGSDRGHSHAVEARRTSIAKLGIGQREHTRVRVLLAALISQLPQTEAAR